MIPQNQKKKNEKQLPKIAKSSISWQITRFVAIPTSTFKFFLFLTSRFQKNMAEKPYNTTRDQNLDQSVAEEVFVPKKLIQITTNQTLFSTA